MTFGRDEPIRIRYWWCAFDDLHGISPKYKGAAVVKAWDYAGAVGAASTLVYGERWMVTLYEFPCLPADLDCVGKLYRGADGSRELAALVEWPVDEQDARQRRSNVATLAATMKLANKDVVLFWLRRHAREVEARTAPPNQEAMANAGMTYGDRTNMVAKAEKIAESSKVELASLEAAIAFVEENG